MSDTPKKTPAKKTAKATSPAAASKTAVKTAAPAKPATPKTTAPAAETKIAAKPRVEPTHEQISRRAHEIHAERGHKHGSDAQDWLQAEQELKNA